jgi:hypothetical protein
LYISFIFDENKKGILILLPIVIILILFFIPFNKVKMIFNDYDCEAGCESLSIIANDGISHSLEGSKIITHSYSVHYSFKVDGLSYEDRIVLNNDLSNNKLIAGLKEGVKSKIIVQYNCDNPYESIIKIDQKEN